MRASDDAEIFRYLVEGVRDYGIFMLGPGGHVTTWNAGAERIKGYSAEEILGRHFSAFYPPEDVGAGKPARELEFAAEHGVYEEEGWRLRKDGSRFWASVVITALRGPDGSLRGFAKVTRDVTERRRTEDERLLALERERAAREAAEAALQQRDDFISIAAHELKTPVTTLRVMAQLVGRQLDRTGVLDPALAGRAFQAVNLHSNKLARLIDQLLDVSRIAHGRLVLERVPADLAALVEGTVAAARLRTSKHTFALRAAGPAMAEVDAIRLEQVVINLLDNAIKYTPDGSRIDVVLEPDGADNLRLLVTDEGLGIAPEHRPYIFDQYYRAHAASHLSGMGLGLHVSRQIAELHGGQLGAEFPPGGGTRFVLTVPRRAAGG